MSHASHVRDDLPQVSIVLSPLRGRPPWGGRAVSGGEAGTRKAWGSTARIAMYLVRRSTSGFRQLREDALWTSVQLRGRQRVPSVERLGPPERPAAPVGVVGERHQTVEVLGD